MSSDSSTSRIFLKSRTASCISFNSMYLSARSNPKEQGWEDNESRREEVERNLNIGEKKRENTPPMGGRWHMLPKYFTILAKFCPLSLSAISEPIFASTYPARFQELANVELQQSLTFSMKIREIPIKSHWVSSKPLRKTTNSTLHLHSVAHFLWIIFKLWSINMIHIILKSWYTHNISRLRSLDK